MAKKKRASAREAKKQNNFGVKIKVVGVGGGGGNAISRMYDDIGVRGLEFIAINTDAQDLEYCKARRRIHIGKNLTRGLGTGMNPDIGRQAAEENRSEIVEAFKGADLVFLTIGLGGGTGSGAGAVVAEAARESGALTIAVVTKPFSFEGAQRARIAEEALQKLREKVDTIIVVPNDRIFSIIKKDTPLLKAFEYIDDVLRSGVEGIAELVASPGIINVDFADVRTIMKDSGPALVGIGTALGAERAMTAVNQVINSPLLEVSVEGARSVLFGVAANRDLRMAEINEVAKVIAASVDSSARIIFGAYYDRKLKTGQLKVTLIATGFGGSYVRSSDFSAPSLFSEGGRTMPIREEKPESGSVADRGEARGDKKEKKELEKQPEKKDDDIWEIPTFLRKKKK